jgi:hypothetical protein
MRRQAQFISVAIGLLALAVAAVAWGAGGVSIVKNTESGIDPGPSSRAADCAAGDHVLGGGFKTSDDSNLAQVDMPSADDSWATETLTSGGKASAFAVCEKASHRKLDIAKHAVLIPTSTGGTIEQTVKAKCDKGWKVVSGGYEVRPPFHGGDRGEIAIDTNMRVRSRIWKVNGGSDGKATKLFAYAVCEKESEGKITQVSHKDSTGEPETATAHCPNGSHVVGGGFRIKPNEAHGIFPNVSASYPASEGSWKSRLVLSPPMKHGVIPPHTLTSYAECEED